MRSTVDSTLAAPAASARRPALDTAARYAWALIAIGVLLRLLAFIANRSLWLDEAMLALNIVAADTRTLLTGPLEYHQGAPPLFLLLEKLSVTVLGPNEYALRLVPVVCGCAALPVFYLAARRLLTPWPATLAAAMLALGPMPIYFADEAKQYGGDLLACVLLLYLALRVLESPTRRCLATLAIVGAICPWFSHASVFLLAGIGTTFLARALVKRDALARAPRFFAAVALIMLWLLSFLALYLLTLRHLVGDAYLAAFWEQTGGLLPFPPTTIGEAAAYPRAAVRIARDLFAPPAGVNGSGAELAKIAGGFALALALLGIAALKNRRRMLLLLPLAFATVASMLGKYPFFERLALFAHPLLIVLACAGLAQIVGAMAPGRARIIAAVAGGLLLLALPQDFAGRLVTSPLHRDELRDLLRDIAARPHDASPRVVYTLAGARAPTQFYAQTTLKRDLTDTLILHGPAEIWRPEFAHVSELDVLRQQFRGTRVWIVLSTTWHPLYARQEDNVKRQFDAAGTRLDELHRPGAAAYLYDLRPSP